LGRIFAAPLKSLQSHRITKPFCKESTSQPRVSCKSDYFKTPGSDSKSRAWEFFTGDHIDFAGQIPNAYSAHIFLLSTAIIPFVAAQRAQRSSGSMKTAPHGSYRDPEPRGALFVVSVGQENFSLLLRKQIKQCFIGRLKREVDKLLDSLFFGRIP